MRYAAFATVSRTTASQYQWAFAIQSSRLSSLESEVNAGCKKKLNSKEVTHVEIPCAKLRLIKYISTIYLFVS